MGMDYFSRDLTAELVAQMVDALRQNEETAQQDRIDEIDDFYFNHTSDAGKQAKYFEQGDAETDDEYKQRNKISVFWSRIFIQYQIYYYWYGTTKYEWMPKSGEADEATTALIEQANAITQQMQELNCYHAHKQTMLQNTLVYGSTAAKPMFWVRHPDNGIEIKSGDASGRGNTYWQEIQAGFFVPIMHPKLHDRVQAVVVCYDADGNRDYIANYSIKTERRRILEYISADYYNTRTGAREIDGQWKAWEFNPLTDKAWVPIEADGASGNTANPYNIMPLVIWKTIDGESVVWKAREILKQYNKQISQIANVLTFMGQPMLQFTGPAPAKGNSLQIGANRILYTGDPDGRARFELLQPAYSDGPANTLLSKFESFLSYMFSVPLEVISGNVDSSSGIQLKMLFQSIIKLREAMQMTIGQAEQEMMYKSLYIYEMENGGKHIYTDALKPVVTYEKDILPVDDAAELTNDIIKLDKKIVTLADLVIKHNPAIKTKEEAEAYIEKVGVQVEAEINTETDNLRDELEL